MRGGQVRPNDVLQVGGVGRGDLQAVSQQEHAAGDVLLVEQRQAPFQRRGSSRAVRPAGGSVRPRRGRPWSASCCWANCSAFSAARARWNSASCKAAFVSFCSWRSWTVKAWLTARPAAATSGHDAQDAGRRRRRVAPAPAPQALAFGRRAGPRSARRPGSGAGRRPGPRRWRSARRAPSRGTSGRSSPGRAAPAAASATAAPAPASAPGPACRAPSRPGTAAGPSGLVEDGPQGVHVGRRADRPPFALAPGLLGRHVAGRADDRAGRRQVAARRRAGEAEVGDLGGSSAARSLPDCRQPTVGPLDSRTFAGFRSRWTMPCSWAWCTARASVSTSAAACARRLRRLAQPVAQAGPGDELQGEEAAARRARRPRRSARCSGAGAARPPGPRGGSARGPSGRPGRCRAAS